MKPTPTKPDPLADEIEIRLIDRPYSHLRIRKSGRQVEHVTLQEPPHSALVVRREGGRFVLIDGEDLVDAIVQLNRDTVHVLVLDLSEEAALSHCYRMQREGRRTALEEGWLVAELLDRGRPLPQIGMSLGRSTSWVSRRLGLARSLPEIATDAVRRGIVPPHGAMKSLLPLARANEKYCAKLCERIGNKPISSRQLEAICKALRTADAVLRDRILESPWLFIEAKEAITPALPDGMAGELVRELNAARLALLRACDTASRTWTIDIGALSETPVKRALQRCVDAFESFERHMEEPHAI